MKKFVSILLALVMVLSLVPMALAEEIVGGAETAETVETAEPAPVETETKSETSAPAALGGATETEKVAKVGEIEYATLAEAVEKAQSGQTIELLTDVELEVAMGTSGTLVPQMTVSGKQITLNLAGHKVGYSAESKAKNVTGTPAVFSVMEGAELTVEGNGTIDAELGNNGSYGFNVKGGKLIINDGKYYGAPSAVQVQVGEAVIKGGFFDLAATIKTAAPAQFIYLINGIDKNYKDGTAKVTISGGTFVKFNPNKSFSENPEADFLASGYGVKQDGDSYIVKPLAEVAVAKIGESYYKTLAEAVAAANGKTVTLLKGVTEAITIPAGKTVTLDLNGHTLNGGKNNDKAALLNEGTVTIKDSSAGKTGTIKREDDADKTGTTYYVIKNNGTMTIEQANVINNSGYKKTNPAGSMAGSSLICNGDRKDDEKTTLTINDGVFEQQNFLVVKNGTFGILNVNGGKFTSKHSAIQNWYKADIKGGEINGQLWTDAYTWAEGEMGNSAGVTKISGATKFTGDIVMDITLYPGITKGKIPTLEISGGEMNITKWSITEGAAGAGAKPVITGGTFSSNPIDYVQKGYAVTKGKDTEFTVAAVKDTAAVEVTNNSNNDKTSITINSITPDNATGGDTNTIDITSLDQGKGTNEVVVDKGQLEQIVSNTATKPVEFKLADKLTVKFDVDAVKAIAGKLPASGDVTLIVTPKATVSGNELTAQNSVGNAKSQVVTLTLTGSTSTDTLFPSGGKATITVPFDMTGYNRLSVYYLNPTTGKAEYVGAASYDQTAGTATFDVKHFSSYVLVPGKSSSGGGSSSGSGSVGSGTHTVTSDLTGTITKVTVDGKTVASKHYTVSGGNVTFTEAFMKTLSNGTHKVTIETATKIARGTFTVDNGTKPVVSSKTGDAGIALYAGLAIASVMGSGVVLTARKRKNH